MSLSGGEQSQNAGLPAQGRLTEVDLKRHSQELGLLGYIFGSKEHAPYYIAALAIVLAFVMIGLVLFYAPKSTDFPKNEAVTLFGAIITGALGYIFGKSSN